MGWNGTMFSPQRDTSEGQRLIIHHLSDLHFMPDPQSQEHMAFINYAKYLNSLTPDKRPNLVIITGDLTCTGEKNDLRTVATLLRAAFPNWADQLPQRIIVVPGPRDVNWENGVPNFDTFYSVFADFRLPPRDHGAPQPAGTSVSGLHYAAYPMDTCYTPESLPEQIKSELHAQGDLYHEFLRQYREYRSGPAPSGIFRRPRVADRQGLRKSYLDFTEDNPVTLLDAGVVDSRDLEAFRAWANTLGEAARADAAWDPLKILVSHHPLQTYSQDSSANTSSDRGTPETRRNFEELVTVARNAGFHLALHGHMHKPQVVSDLSVLEGADSLHPLRQIGAGSLGDHGIFNEIKAVYLKGEKQRRWWLEIRTVDVQAANPDASSYLLLLNPPEDAQKRADELGQEVNRRREFETRVRWATRQFSENVFKSQADPLKQSGQVTLLPPSAIYTIEAIIREIVFEGYDIRVRLLLKDALQRPPTFVPTYLVPLPASGGVGSLVYPASIAAWALILGRSLISPDIVHEELKEHDYDWLRRSGRAKDAQDTLRQLIEKTMRESLPDTKALDRYAALQAKLERLDGPPLRGLDFFQESSSRSQQDSPSRFISVPIPLRPVSEARPILPEIGVLDVRVYGRRQNAEQPVTAEAENVFTADRVEMLESLSEVIATILCTSSALGKPRGIWEERSGN